MLEATSSPVVFCHNDCQEGKLLIFHDLVQWCSIKPLRSLVCFLRGSRVIKVLPWQLTWNSSLCTPSVQHLQSKVHWLQQPFRLIKRMSSIITRLSQARTHALMVQVSWRLDPWVFSVKTVPFLAVCNIHDQGGIYFSPFKRKILKKYSEWWKQTRVVWLSSS